MRRHRLDRLSKLTQGAALVSLGALAACNSNGDTKHVNAPAPQPSEPIHVNAPPTAMPSASVVASGAPIAPPPTINAPPPPAPSASVARPQLPRVNAPPHLAAPPPKE